MAKAKKSKVKSQWKRFSQQMKSGKLPKNALTQKLSKFFGKRGNPLKRQLRSEKQRKEFNKLLSQFNKERPTIEKEQTKREAIRKKQLDTRRKNVSPKRAKKAVEKYEKILDIMEAVHDDIGFYISYEEAEEMTSHNEKMDAEKISKFIVSRYKEMQDNLPDFAKDNTSLTGVMATIQQTIKDVGSYNLDEIEDAMRLKASNPARYARKYRVKGRARR